MHRIFTELFCDETRIKLQLRKENVRRLKRRTRTNNETSIAHLVANNNEKIEQSYNGLNLRNFPPSKADNSAVTMQHTTTNITEYFGFVSYSFSTRNAPIFIRITLQYNKWFEFRIVNENNQFVWNKTSLLISNRKLVICQWVTRRRIFWRNFIRLSTKTKYTVQREMVHLLITMWKRVSVKWIAVYRVLRTICLRLEYWHNWLVVQCVAWKTEFHGIETRRRIKAS